MSNTAVVFPLKVNTCCRSAERKVVVLRSTQLRTIQIEKKYLEIHLHFIHVVFVEFKVVFTHHNHQAFNRVLGGGNGIIRDYIVRL